MDEVVCGDCIFAKHIVKPGQGGLVGCHFSPETHEKYLNDYCAQGVSRTTGDKFYDIITAKVGATKA